MEKRLTEDMHVSIHTHTHFLVIVEDSKGNDTHIKNLHGLIS